MNGILLVDKPVGWTSFDVVAKIRRILASHQSQVTSNQSKNQVTSDRRQSTPSPKVKVGHTGTLDPLASGLLVLLIGSYTKRASEFSKLDKTYEVTMKLGQTSTTGDPEGIITSTKNVRSDIKRSKVEKVLNLFIGEIMQVPPAYSAIKVDGQRAYKLARAGKEVKLEPRKITVYSIQLTDYSYPLVRFTAEVSSGTYVRSLVEDIGKDLKIGAYMTALKRTKVGTFTLIEALEPQNLTAEHIYEHLLT